LKMTSTSTAPSLLVMNLGFTDKTLRRRTIISVKDAKFTTTQKKHDEYEIMSNQY
jgi:hypothetical protein